MIHILKHSKGCVIKIYYLNNINDTVNLYILDNCINDIYENTYRHDGNWFSKLTIEVWDDRLPDIPVTKNVCSNGVCYKELGIADYAGLTSASNHLIQLNHLSIDTLEKMSQCLSHEFGHYKAYWLGFNNTLYKNNNLNKAFNSFYKSKVEAIMMKNKEIVNIDELIAENIRKFDGGRLARNTNRGSQVFLDSGNNAELRSLLLLWKASLDYTNNILKLPFSDIQNASIDYADKMFYISFDITFNYFLFKITHKIRINITGIYKVNKTDNTLIKSFI